MKIRKTLQNKNTQKNVVVYEHDKKIIANISDYGMVDPSVIKSITFNSIEEYEEFEKEFSPTSIMKTGLFKNVPIKISL